MVSEAIAQGNTNALNYFVAQKYIEALKAFAESSNQKVFFMPVEATSLLASLGGIAELAKDTLGKGAAVSSPRTPAAPPVATR
jgi:regulator of protease activity HflC (stomatin/prohibitin superfamily)